MRSFVVSLVVFGGLCVAQTKITSVEGITQYKLDNGMDVLLFPDKSKPTVTVNVTYMVGSRHEGYGETGMAHLLEHMVYKGTKNRPDIKVELANHGANFNGSTSYDRTNYFETMDASDANLKWALEMEADRMVNSKVAKSDLDSEMTVVRSEFEMGENSPTRVLEERVLSTAYLWHGYGRSTIGARSDIEKVPIDRLQAFYRNYYQPDNAMLVVAGDFDEAKTLGWIKETFGAIPKPSRKLIPTYTDEPVQDGEREVNLRRTGDVQALMAVYHIPAGAHPDSPALEVLAEILNTPPAGRLYKALVEAKKAVATEGDTYQLHDPGVAVFSVRLRKEQSINDAEKTMLAVIDEVVKEPPSKEEVDRARTHLLKNIDLALNNSQRIGILLSEWQSMGDWRLMFIDRDRIQKVTPEDVARVAKIYLKTSNRTIGRFMPDAKPERAEIPAAPDVAALVKDYKGNAAVEQGEAFDASPANIDTRTVRITLPNGMKLALLSKKTRGATVTAALTIHYGDEKSLANKDAAAQVTAAMLMRGTQKHNRQQIQDELDKLKAQMTTGGTTIRGADLSITTVRAGFAGALRLAAEVLREPAFPETEFEQIRTASIGRIEGQKHEPQALTIAAMNRHLNPYPTGDPRAIETIEESIDGLKKLTLADVKKFHADFYGTSNAELAVVGDFDVAEMQKLANELFGSWKSPTPYTMIQRSWRKVDVVNQTIETPDKANAFFATGMTMALSEEDPDFPALLFANTMIGGGTRSRLWLRIREKDGLSYAVQSAFQAGATDKFAQLLAVAICNPQNMTKVESAFKEELAKLAGDGFAADEVDIAKKAFMQEQQVSRAQDSFLVRRLARNAQHGWTMDRDAELERKIAALTPADINAAVKRHVDPAAFSYFKGGDFKKASSAQ
ncbi:MAG TPA: pitrilysin family protein [Bryobacteraceae bacterium]|nr:pitrilysin family protein [Bryobacteraceae bacterium]